MGKRVSKRSKNIKKTDKEIAKRLDLLSEISKEFKKEAAKENPRSIVLDSLFNELYNFATKDHLTGAFNKQALGELLGREMQRAFDDKLPLTIIMFDIDDFKKYNDRFGHLQGDEALRAVTKTVIRKTRKEDFVARYGGEEFMIVLIDTQLKKAVSISEEIRKEIANTKIKKVARDVNPGFERVTVSMGIAQLTKKGINDMIYRADMALYRAKLEGKNRICASKI